jgi:hypothetical protein
MLRWRYAALVCAIMMAAFYLQAAVTDSLFVTFVAAALIGLVVYRAHADRKERPSNPSKPPRRL